MNNELSREYIEVNPDKNMLEVKLKNPEDDFLVIKETLQRIGVPKESNKTIMQTCHILYKKNRYFIVHFKEMFALDNKAVNYTQEDMYRRNKIASLLEEWELCDIIQEQYRIPNNIKVPNLKILPKGLIDSGEWRTESKYKIGKKRRTSGRTTFSKYG